MDNEDTLCHGCFRSKYVNDFDQFRRWVAGKICFSCHKKEICVVVEKDYLRTRGGLSNKELKKKRTFAARSSLKMIFKNLAEVGLEYDGLSKICFIDELISALRVYRRELYTKEQRIKKRSAVEGDGKPLDEPID